MTEITVRFQTDEQIIDPDFFNSLNHLAEKYGLRVKENTQSMIDPVDKRQKLSHEEFVRKADEISRRIGPVKSDSTDDIRELRDSR